MSPTTLMCLPREVRDQILTAALSTDQNITYLPVERRWHSQGYKTLLADDNKSYTKYPAAGRGKAPSIVPLEVSNLTSPLCRSIFSTIPQLKREAEELEERTPFVTIGCADSNFLRNYVRKLIPMQLYFVPRLNPLFIYHNAVSCFWIEHGRSPGWFGVDSRPPGTEGYMAIISPDHVPILIELINAYHTYFRFKGPDSTQLKGIPISEIFCHFATPKDKFTGKVIRKLVEDLKGLRDGWCSKDSPYEVPDIVETTAEPVTARIVLSITGQDAATTEELTSTRLPPLSPNECIQEARKLKSQGDAFQKADYNYAARTKYILAATMLAPGKTALLAWANHNLQPTGPNHHHELPIEAFKLLLDIYLDLSRLNSRCANDFEAHHTNTLATKLLHNIVSPEMTSIYNKEEKASIFIHYYHNTVDHGEFDQAGSALQYAMKWIPEQTGWLTSTLQGFAGKQMCYCSNNNITCKELRSKREEEETRRVQKMRKLLHHEILETKNKKNFISGKAGGPGGE